jgi:hypothetical protein
MCPVEAGTDPGGGTPAELVAPGAGLAVEPAALLGAGPQAQQAQQGQQELCVPVTPDTKDLDANENGCIDYDDYTGLTPAQQARWTCVVYPSTCQPATQPPAPTAVPTAVPTQAPTAVPTQAQPTPGAADPGATGPRSQRPDGARHRR